MSGIVLSNSVRQNLLSLQSTANLLSQTQSRLSTGKKVNSALDNPTNFFTASSLDARASDINNLLDGIGNGVQILQAANTGITSLQKLVSTAQSLANQALQTSSGYTSKSNVSTTIAGATSDDLRGTTSFTNATANSNVVFSGAAGSTTAVALADTLGGPIGSLAGTALTPAAAADATGSAGSVLNTGGTTATATGATLISALTSSSVNSPSGPVAGDSLTVNGKTITFTTSGAAAKDSNGNYTIGIDQTLNSLLGTVDAVNGNTTQVSAVVAGSVVLHTGTTGSLAVTDSTSGTTLTKLGINASGAHTVALGSGATAAITGATKLFNTVGALSTTSIADGSTLTVNGKTITFRAAVAPAAASVPAGSGILGNVQTDGSGNSTIYLGTSTTNTTATVSDVLTAVDLASGVKTATINTVGVAAFSTNSGQTASSVVSGAVTLKSSTGADLSLSGSADFLNSLALTSSVGPGQTTVTAARTTSSSTVGSLIQDGSTLNVNGHTITFKNAATPAASSTHTGVTGNVETDGNGNSTVYLESGTVTDVLKAIDLATGVQTAALGVSGATVATAAGATNSSVSASGALKISTGTVADLSIAGTGNALSALGLTGATGTAASFSAARGSSTGGVNGKTLTFSSFNGGAAVNVTFGDGTNGTVKSLAQLNTALQANNQTATVDANGVLTISASNDFASSTLGSTDGGAIGGTLTTSLTFTVPKAPVADPVAQTTRANLVSQYNNILEQISTTSQDASFNGVNLLGGDTLKLVFNETGKSTLSITGVTFNSSGLGLANLTSGTDFIDNSSTNKVLSTLNTAATTLRSQASALGSNLTIVQVRQDFSKDLINVLQTGSSNLTLADTNEEAANSQALSTRQSIAVSALSLANTSQQSVLQLLR
jgi:flagellin